MFNNSLIADDKMIITGDESDADYMFRKLKEEYEKWILKINVDKTEYMKIGNTHEEDPDLQLHRLNECSEFKYLGSIFR